MKLVPLGGNFTPLRGTDAVRRDVRSFLSTARRLYTLRTPGPFSLAVSRIRTRARFVPKTRRTESTELKCLTKFPSLTAPESWREAEITVDYLGRSLDP